MTISFRLSTRRFGELLVERGKVTPEQLAKGLETGEDRERLGQTLIRMGVITEQDVAELLGEQFSLPLATPEVISNADPEAVKVIPEQLAKQACMIAIKQSEDAIEVAMGDPLDVVSLDHLRALTGRTIRVLVAKPADVR